MSTTAKTKSKTMAATTGAEIIAHINDVILGPATRLEELAKKVTAKATELNTTFAPPDTEPLMWEAVEGDTDLEAVADRIAHVVSEAAAARAHAEHNQAVADGLRAQGRGARAQAERARAECHGEVIAYLAQQLDGVVNDTRALAEQHPHLIGLAQVHADPALIGASQEQGRVMDAYRTIRAQQREAYKREQLSSGSGWVHVNVRSGLLRDAINTDAHWVNERLRIGANRAQLANRAGGTASPAAAWFTDVKPVPFAVIAPGRDHAGDDLWTWLIWAVEHAEMWVPTITELEDADAANEAMLSRPPVNRPHGRTGRRAS